MIEKAIQVALETDKVWSELPLNPFINFGSDIRNQEAKKQYNDALEKLYEVASKYRLKAEANLCKWTIITNDPTLTGYVKEKLKKKFTDESTPIMQYTTNWLKYPSVYFCNDRDKLQKEVLEALGIENK